MQHGSTLWDLADAGLRHAQFLLPLLALLVAGLALRTARLHAKRAALQEHRLQALTDAAFDALLIVRAGQIVAANPAIVRLMGIGPAWFDQRRVDTLLDSPTSHPGPSREHSLILPDGSRHPVEVVTRPIEGTAEHVVAIRDLGPQQMTLAQIERLSHSDLLTGVGNRQALERSLNKMISMSDRSGAPFALLCIDLDRFRSINESLGPDAGDQVLIQSAGRLIATVRELDTVARVGSDEFAILQPLAGRSTDAAALADRIITEMSLPFRIGTHSVAVGASVGVAIYPTDGTTAAELLTNGALALDRAKRDGRGVWRYCQPGMDQQVRERQALAHDLGVALAEHQFSLAYQPVFDAQTLTVVGYEALLRWSHPVLGAIPPARFIPIAEECGLIVPISHWVLRTACAEAATWANPLSISINLSPAQFLQEDVAERVKSVLEETGLAPGRLELEITEGVTMADTQRALEMLRALRRLGVKLSMDDFGTGYSSLSYLRRFPFDKLKIDRSFIRDLDENEDAQPIVQAIIALSRSLRLEVTAEGVETERQLAYLRDSGCCYVQGYLLGLPEPAAQIHGTTRSAGSAPDQLPVSRAPGPPATDSACAVA